MRNQCLLLALCGSVLAQTVAAQPTSPPTELNLVVSNSQKWISWPRPTIPAWEVNQLSVTTNFSDWFTIPSNSITVSPSGYVYRAFSSLPQQFYHLTLEQLSSNDVAAAQVLNRLSYGPTPDDLDHVRSIGPQAFINEQLAPETLANTTDDYTLVYTNAGSLPPGTNWVTVSVTGRVSSSTFYMYLTDVGSAFIDDVKLQILNTVVDTNTVPPTTNTTLGPNVLVNSDFEQPLSVGWTVANNMSPSTTIANPKYEGNFSCRMIATSPGSTGTSAIRQTITPALPNNARCVLSFAYLPGQKSRFITLRLSGSGVNISGDDIPQPPGWVYVTATGRATSSPYIYLYLSQAGEGWIDDIKLVQGDDPDAGSNLLQNPGFENTLSPWLAVNNHSGSHIDTSVAFSGTSSLHLVATGAGSGNTINGNSVVQQVPVVNNQIYTLSYWYRPATRSRTTTARLSGSQLVSSPDTTAGGLRRRLDEGNWGVSLNDMRAWFCHNGIASPRQLLEVLTQFLENHFVTYHSKTRDYFDGSYPNDGTDTEGLIATDLEYREVYRWREALLNPNCTFYDLLKIHVESPAQIIYLDTVGSRGNANNVANENYARELFELFAMGVDNGYDQNDIVAMSRAWTGWTINIVDRQYVARPGGTALRDNPFAPRSQQFGRYPGVGFGSTSNIIGVWSFVFDASRHGTNRAPILSEWDPNAPATDPRAIGPKRIPARFGPPWAGTSYQLSIPARPTGQTNGIQDGYDVIRHLAEGPASVFTAEYISVKLCRLFIHDSFPNPTTHSELPEYDFYDYTDPARTAEAELIRRCIVAWQSPAADGRKGNIRQVLRTIFDSELFRSHAGSRQKAKTPIEFCISALRAMRSVDAGGASTLNTDGRLHDQLSRMGGMSLFNRADPDGYPEDGASWISAGTLAERLRFVQAFCTNPNASNPGRPSDAGNHTVDPVTLLQRKLPQASLKNPYHVADFFVRLFFFGEGTANLDLYRDAAVQFLNDGSADPPRTPPTNTLLFNDPGIPVSNAANTAYDHRVRGLVSFLMTTQRFQEQ